MNRDRLLEAEARFLTRYPDGFDDPAMAAIKKKHDVDKLVEFTRESLTRTSFNRPELVADTVLKIVSRSSMVSRFEKPRFRDFIGCMNSAEKEAFADALEKRLYGRAKRRGFEELVGMLQPHKLAKWSVVSVVPFYFSPRTEAFVKPTTAKGILEKLEVRELHYHPTPTWEFYQGYRGLLREIRATVSPSLSPNYAALTGFLMTSL
ncbi:MAG: hypothetical protein R3228_18075 [Halioglobus sp.]|nr:hypothetical protein [Halioglobus sp.]